MKTEILKYLKEADGYVSGQDLSDRLGVSRTAVWKIIRQLEDEGYVIEAVRNRGYRLGQQGEVYTAAEIESVIDTERAGRNLVFLDEVDSTNTRLRQLAEEGAPEGTLVVARKQTAGKGRRGRSWVSPKGSDIYMSLLLRPDFEPACASMLTLIAAMAVEAGIRKTTGLDCRIKWPNDIVVDGKKVCGILTEMSTEMESIHYVIVGIGINVGMREFPEEIRETATSLMLALGDSVNKAQVIAAVMRAWEDYYGRYLQTLDLSLLRDEYNSELVNCGREVKVLAAAGSYTGVSRGINSQGELLVEIPDGTVRSVVSGEVSVRGVYGYV